MKKTARLIVTEVCNRACPNCVNKQTHWKPADTSVFELIGRNYEEIIITGGEPMLISEKVYHFINYLKEKGFTGKVYLYTAFHQIGENSFDKALIELVDGITYTLHFESTEDDFNRLDELSHYILELNEEKPRNDRLSIDDRIAYKLSAHYLANWGHIRSFSMLKECPIKEHEDILFYQL